MRLCSACLLGVKCLYNGRILHKEKILQLAKTETLIPVCPEQLGGLPTPRPPARLQGDGSEIIGGQAKVIDGYGKDITGNFLKGAEETLKLVKSNNITEVIFKKISPSCGNSYVRIAGKVVKGEGVTTALLRKNGIKVISEEDL